MAMAVRTPASPKAAAIGMQPVVSQPVDLVLGFLKHQFATPKDHRNWLYTPLRLHSPSLPPAQPGRALCVKQEFESSPPGSPLSLKAGSCACSISHRGSGAGGHSNGTHWSRGSVPPHGDAGLTHGEVR